MILDLFAQFRSIYVFELVIYSKLRGCEPVRMNVVDVMATGHRSCKAKLKNQCGSRFPKTRARRLQRGWRTL